MTTERGIQMSRETYEAGRLIERWDATARTYTAWDANGQVTETRPFTPAESARADEAAQQEALAAAQAELDRAVFVAAAPAELAAVQTLTLAAQGITDGDPWRQPSGAHDAYPVGATVTHDGKQWENLTPANVWTPPINWREIVTEGYPAWVQPTGAGDAYNVGDRVTFEGQDWESTINANVWSPTGYPAGWKLV